jgi:peroxiredoxin
MKKLSHLLVIAGFILLPVIAEAGCGSCPGDKKDDGCSKKSCDKDESNGDKKECKSECKKECSNGNGDKKECSNGNGDKKECSNGNGEKKACCGEDGKCCKSKCGGNGNGDAVHSMHAPDFTLTALYHAKNADGEYELKTKEVTLSDFQGKKNVVLEWINYDCPFVVPHYKNDTMEKLSAKYADDDVVWLTINTTHYADMDAHKEFMQEQKLKHQHLLADPDGKVGRKYKAQTTPHIFIIDKQGHVVYEGAIDNAPRGRKPQGQAYVNYVDQALSELVAGQEISTAKTSPYGCSVKYAPKK